MFDTIQNRTQLRYYVYAQFPVKWSTVLGALAPNQLFIGATNSAKINNAGDKY